MVAAPASERFVELVGIGMPDGIGAPIATSLDPYIGGSVKQKIGRRVAALASVLAASVLAAVVLASPAQAAPTAATASADLAIAAVEPLCSVALLTGFGPVKMCIRPVHSSTAQMYYHSEITGENSAITGELEVLDPSLWTGIVEATDGKVARLAAFARLNTGFGGVRWGFQNQESLRLARFGAYNVVTGLFYPSSDRWFPY